MMCKIQTHILNTEHISGSFLSTTTTITDRDLSQRRLQEGSRGWTLDNGHCGQMQKWHKNNSKLRTSTVERDEKVLSSCWSYH